MKIEKHTQKVTSVRPVVPQYTAPLKTSQLWRTPCPQNKQNCFVRTSSNFHQLRHPCAKNYQSWL